MPPLVKTILWKKLVNRSGKAPRSNLKVCGCLYRKKTKDWSNHLVRISVRTESPISWLTTWAFSIPSLVHRASAYISSVGKQNWLSLYLLSLLDEWVGEILWFIRKAKPKMVKHHHTIVFAQMTCIREHIIPLCNWNPDLKELPMARW